MSFFEYISKIFSIHSNKSLQHSPKKVIKSSSLFMNLPKDDLFGRQHIVDFLYKMLTTSSIECSPLLINGSWGIGKTVFCKKLIQKLGYTPLYKCIYIDAYEESKISDPILSIALNLSKFLQKKDKIDFLGCAVGISSFLFQTVICATSYKLVGENFEISENGSSLMKRFNKSMGKDLKNLSTLYEDKNKILKELISIVDKSNQKFIIFIDELDRCSPEYCLLFIEKIKYIFEESNLQFVIIANKNQITKFVECRYGININSEEYMSKYIKAEICIPEIYFEDISTGFEKANNDNEKLIYLMNFHSSVKYFIVQKRQNSELKDISNVELFVAAIICKNSMSLREVERLILYLSIFQKMSVESQRLENRSSGYAKLVILFIALSCMNSDRKYSYLKNPNDLKKLKKIYNYNGKMEIHKNDYESGLDAFIDCIYEKDPGQELLKKATKWYFNAPYLKKIFQKYHFEIILSHFRQDLVRFPFLSCYSAICINPKSSKLPMEEDFIAIGH